MPRCTHSSLRTIPPRRYIRIRLGRKRQILQPTHKPVRSEPLMGQSPEPRPFDSTISAGSILRCTRTATAYLLLRRSILRLATLRRTFWLHSAQIAVIKTSRRRSQTQTARSTSTWSTTGAPHIRVQDRPTAHVGGWGASSRSCAIWLLRLCDLPLQFSLFFVHDLDCGPFESLGILHRGRLGIVP